MCSPQASTDLTTLFFFQIFDVSISVCGAEVVFIQCNLEEVLSLPHQSCSQFIIPIHLGPGDFCLSFIPPSSPCFFVWFKSAHSLSKSAHKGHGSICHVSPFPVCLIDQSGIFSWHSPQPQPSHLPKGTRSWGNLHCCMFQQLSCTLMNDILIIAGWKIWRITRS